MSHFFCIAAKVIHLCMVELVPFLKGVERLRWKLQKPVQSLLAGPYRSAFRGEGIEFADARPYEPGDDWRRIHWSLSARKNQPYLRLGQEERELTCVIAIDRSPSMHIAVEKEQLTLTTAVALALSAILNSDRVRWVSFSDRVEYFSPARKGEKLIWGYLAHLWTQPAQGQRSLLTPLLHWIASVHKRRVFLIILSDFFLHEEKAWTLLRSIAQKHFILLVGIYAPQEALSIPWGYLPTREVETGGHSVIQTVPSPLPDYHPSLRHVRIASENSLLPALRRALLPPL